MERERRGERKREKEREREKGREKKGEKRKICSGSRVFGLEYRKSRSEDAARQEFWLREQQICKRAQYIVRTEGFFEDYLISVISKLSVGNLPLLTNSSSSSALFLIPNLSRMVW